MIHVTFNGGLCGSLKKASSNTEVSNNIIMLFLPLEVGNIILPENSKTNEILYNVLAGDGAYYKFNAELKRNYMKLFEIAETEEICFWVDFNDVKQHLNMAYFMRFFDRFKNKFYIEYDFDKYCENPDVAFTFIKNKKPMPQSLVKFLKQELESVQKEKECIFRTVTNKQLISVRDEYFDKYIFEFLDEKPKSCMKLIGEIFSKFGRLSVSFDQVVIRLWMLLREGVVERVGAKTQKDLFFEYEYKLSDHIDMQRD